MSIPTFVIDPDKLNQDKKNDSFSTIVVNGSGTFQDLTVNGTLTSNASVVLQTQTTDDPIIEVGANNATNYTGITGQYTNATGPRHWGIVNDPSTGIINFVDQSGDIVPTQAGLGSLANVQAAGVTASSIVGSSVQGSSNLFCNGPIIETGVSNSSQYNGFCGRYSSGGTNHYWGVVNNPSDTSINFVDQTTDIESTQSSIVPNSIVKMGKMVSSSINTQNIQALDSTGTETRLLVNATGGGLTLGSSGAVTTVPGTMTIGISSVPPNDSSETLGVGVNESSTSNALMGLVLASKTTPSKQLGLGVLTDATTFVQSINQGIAYTSLKLNPFGGDVNVGVSSSTVTVPGKLIGTTSTLYAGGTTTSCLTQTGIASRTGGFEINSTSTHPYLVLNDTFQTTSGSSGSLTFAAGGHRYFDITPYIVTPGKASLGGDFLQVGYSSDAPGYKAGINLYSSGKVTSANSTLDDGSGNMTLSGSLSASAIVIGGSNSSIGGTLTVAQNVTVASLISQGAATVDGSFRAESDVTCPGSVKLGNTTVTGTINVSDMSTLSTVTAGNTTVNGNLNVSGTATAGNTTVNGDLNVSGTATVGSLSLQGNVTQSVKLCNYITNSANTIQNVVIAALPRILFTFATSTNSADITYNSNSTFGDYWLVNTSGLYTFSFHIHDTTSGNIYQLTKYASAADYLSTSAAIKAAAICIGSSGGSDSTINGLYYLSAGSILCFQGVSNTFSNTLTGFFFRASCLQYGSLQSV